MAQALTGSLSVARLALACVECQQSFKDLKIASKPRSGRCLPCGHILCGRCLVTLKTGKSGFVECTVCKCTIVSSAGCPIVSTLSDAADAVHEIDSMCNDILNENLRLKHENTLLQGDKARLTSEVAELKRRLAAALSATPGATASAISGGGTTGGGTTGGGTTGGGTTGGVTTGGGTTGGVTTGGGTTGGGSTGGGAGRSTGGTRGSPSTRPVANYVALHTAKTIVIIELMYVGMTTTEYIPVHVAAKSNMLIAFLKKEHKDRPRFFTRSVKEAFNQILDYDVVELSKT